MFKFAEKKLSIPEIWQSSLVLYRQTIGKVWYIAFIAMLIVTMDANIHVGADSSSALVWHFIILGLLTFLANIILSAVVLHRIYYLHKDPKYPLTSSVSFIITKFPTILAAMLLYGLLAYIGAILLIVPGVFVLILFMMTLPLILFDELKWGDALKQSARLVWGHWWRTFGAIIVPGIIIGGVQTLLNTLADHLGFAESWFYALFAALILSFMKPYMDALILLLFHDLKLNTK